MGDVTYKLRFLVLPDFIYSDNRLNATDIKVYSFINSYKGDKFYFTNDQLGKMFGVSEKTISVSVSRLVKFGYISTNYLIKADGGKIRFIVNNRHYEVVKSEITNSLSERLRTRNDKESKIKENKINTVQHIKKYSSLKDISETDFIEISEKYKVSVGFVKLQFEKLVNYCEAKGRRYKNYKSALRNFVLGDMQRNIERRGDGKYKPVDAREL